MKAKAKLPSILLSLVLAIGLMPASAIASDTVVGNSNTLTAQSAAHTQAEAVAWVNSQANAATKFGDGQCVWLTYYYYQYLGQAGPRGNANQYVNGGAFCPAGWSYQGSPQPGDIAVWTGGSNGHVAVVTEIRGSQMVCVEQNYAGRMYCSPNLHNIDAQAYIRPDWPSPSHNPEGWLDVAKGGDGTVYVRGWALDRDNQNAQLEVHVYVGGTGIDGERHVLKADKARPDVNSALGVAGNHGFEATFQTSRRGTLPVYAHAVNVGGGNNDQLTQVCNATVLEPRGNAVTVPETTYAIRTKMDTSMGLDVAAHSMENKANVWLYKWNSAQDGGASCQKFRLKAAGDGSYYIIATHSDKAVEVTNASTDKGANVAQYAQNQSVAQRWFFDRNPDGTYTIRHRNSGYVMDVSGMKTSNETNIMQHPANGGDNQKFYLVPIDASQWSVSVADAEYASGALTPAPKVTAGGVTLALGRDYTVSYSNNAQPGIATATITGAGGYTGSKSATFQITGTAASVEDGKPIPGESGDSGYSPDKSDGDGDGASEAVGVGGDTDTDVYGDGEGSSHDVADADVYGIVSRTFTGKAQRQSPTVKLGGKTLKAGTDYTLSYANNVTAGTAILTVNGKGAYAGTKQVRFTIAKANVKNTTAAKIKSQKYKKGKAVKPSPKLTYGGKALKKGADYTLTYKNNKKRGTATITVKGKGNFKGTKTVKFKIK